MIGLLLRHYLGNRERGLSAPSKPLGNDMSHGRNKYQSRENRARVRQILLQDWDPIGVRDIAEASDEYDRYADRAYVMLMDERATAESIASYLYGIAVEYMGLGHSTQGKEDARSVAETLVALRPEFETH
ncbi:hypothetical protein ACFW16_29645 [Inquilinus sp. NPDC058860]|uniref:hypothetical protein n=1 Tax=Inquilinus sp. NPDC058860 TaxID=3346652 RepID=UPI0036CB1692